MKPYFAYIRVSTVKQGEHGSSLQEQRDAISAFAQRNDLNIIRWFEERETAAKVGRQEFSRLFSALKKRQACGVIFHKIDRSARNLRDWSTVQDLADQGVEVRFTQESVNLSSNEGKLTGDFLAVISAHYIRNLREEVRKGIQGRLKQGLYPLAAPLGYLDQGGGKPKIPDPSRAPLVRAAFELYASGLSLRALTDEMNRRSLRSKSGKKVGISHLSEILRNPFYMGIIRMRRSGQFYDGIHEPIITRSLFARVQSALCGRANIKVHKHDFLFRRMIHCAECGRLLTGEKQKGHVYYRCHSKRCAPCSIREEVIEQAIRDTLHPFRFSDEERAQLHEMNAALKNDWDRQKSGYEQAVKLQLDAVNNRLSRFMDLYLEGAFERPLFEVKKLSLLLERKDLEDRQREFSSNGRPIAQKVSEYFERLDLVPLSYEMATDAEKREILKTVISNFTAKGKYVVVELRSPFREVANLDLVLTGPPVRNNFRTRARRVFDLLVNYSTAQVKEGQQQEQDFRAVA